MINKYRIVNSISGIWNSYGCPPNEGNSISLSIEDNDDDESLIELLGFDDRPLKQDIGRIRQSQTISECVVMIPMIKKNEVRPTNEGGSQGNITVTTVDPCECVEDPCSHRSTNIQWNSQDPQESEKYKDLYYSEVEDAYLFKIDESLIAKILDLDPLNPRNWYSFTQIKDIFFDRLKNKKINTKNNIVKLMYHMFTYNFPPHLNWLKFPDIIPPVVIYSAPFTINLSKGDLADIWQGRMPNPALYPSEQLSSIRHRLDNEEDFFYGYDLKNYKDIKMKIFKCKYHSDGNYYKLLNDQYWQDNLDKRWYNYNWPYDNCSIIEYLSVRQNEIKNNDNQAKLEKALSEENG